MRYIARGREEGVDGGEGVRGKIVEFILARMVGNEYA